MVWIFIFIVFFDECYVLLVSSSYDSYGTAQRATSGGRNLAEHAQKVELLKEQYDMAQMKVESCKVSSI